MVNRSQRYRSSSHTQEEPPRSVTGLTASEEVISVKIEKVAPLVTMQGENRKLKTKLIRAII